MPDSLRERRDNAKRREAKVEKAIASEELDLKKIQSEIEEEREERDQFEKRRKELREAIEDEIKADERGRGDHPDKWEEWAESRRDELADLIDASQSRLDRIVREAARDAKLLADLKRKDGKLDKRIDILTDRIERIANEPQGQLTKDFHVEEFNCNDGTRIVVFCPYMVPHLKALCVNHLQPLRDSGGSVHSNSALRHRAYNASIGGATSSYHIYELRKTAPADDHVQSGRSASSVQAWHEAHNPFDGMGFYAGFTHGDDRGYRSRWYGIA